MEAAEAVAVNPKLFQLCHSGESVELLEQVEGQVEGLQEPQRRQRARGVDAVRGGNERAEAFQLLGARE